MELFINSKDLLFSSLDYDVCSVYLTFHRILIAINTNLAGNLCALKTHKIFNATKHYKQMIENNTHQKAKNKKTKVEDDASSCNCFKYKLHTHAYSLEWS